MTTLTTPTMSVGDQIAYKKKKYAESRRKHFQAGLSALGAGAGAASLGLVTAGKVKKIPKLVEHGYTTGSIGAGIGAVSGANFARNQLKEAQEAREKARNVGMTNTHALKKSLSDITKAKDHSRHYKREKPPTAEAWRMAGGRSEDWRDYVSQGAQHAYDVPLHPSRVKRDRNRRASNALAVGAGATPVAGLVFGGKKGAAAGGVIGTGMGVGSWATRNQAEKYDRASRKIRAKGFQRQLDERVTKGVRVGGFVRTPAGVTHRSGALITKMPKAYRRTFL